MKNILLIAVLAILSFSAFAQSENTINPVKTNENTFGPLAGDFVIGLDLVPLLKIMGGETNSTDYINKQSVLGRYFLSEDLALRFNIQAGGSNYSDSRLITDDANLDPLSRAEIEDVRTVNTGEYALALGAEFRNNHKKFKSYYGFEVVGLYGYFKEDFHRANAFTDINTSPTYWNFDGWFETNGTNRMLSRDNGNYWAMGANIFAGFDYYFTNRLAIGSEISWGYQYLREGQASHVNEYYMSGTIYEETIVTSTSEVSHRFGFVNPFVSINLSFTL